jgi:hypothetical protein
MITHDNLKIPPQSLPEDGSSSLPETEHLSHQTSTSSTTPLICRRPVRLTIYALLAAFVLWMLGWGLVPRLLDPNFEQHIQDKSVMAGMSREQVLDTWGSPYQMNVSYTEKGIRREEWIYEDWLDSSTIKHRYLYFEEGKLIGGWY